MIDFSVVTNAVFQDPLVAILGVLAVGGLATQYLFKGRPIARATIRVVSLGILTTALMHADIVPYQPFVPLGAPFRDAVRAILKIAWWVWAAWFLVGVLRTLAVFQDWPQEAKLLQDLLAGLIYVAAASAIAAYVFSIPIQGLLATSGIVAIILSLALQSTLGDLFSGIVLSFSRPYRPGDWISVEGGTDGCVVEINWRSTCVLTARRHLAIVPNSTIAKSRIVNVSSPSGIHGMTVTVQLDAGASPARGREVLEQAILNCRLIVATPNPTITVKAVTATYTEFEITFFIEQLGSSTDAQNELFDWIYRHLAVADIELALPPNQPLRALAIAGSRKTHAAAEKLLGLVAIFASFPSEERATIAARLKQHFYEEGELVVDRGTVVQSLFFIGSGVLSLTGSEIEGEKEVARLGPGDHFGEIGLLTGAQTAGKITALVPSTVYELAKTELMPIVEARPHVARELSRALARRQAQGHLIAPPELGKDVPKHGLTDWFSDRLHKLFELANAG